MAAGRSWPTWPERQLPRYPGRRAHGAVHRLAPFAMSAHACAAHAPVMSLIATPCSGRYHSEELRRPSGMPARPRDIKGVAWQSALLPSRRSRRLSSQPASSSSFHPFRLNRPCAGGGREHLRACPLSLPTLQVTHPLIRKWRRAGGAWYTETSWRCPPGLWQRRLHVATLGRSRRGALSCSFISEEGAARKSAEGRAGVACLHE